MLVCIDIVFSAQVVDIVLYCSFERKEKNREGMEAEREQSLLRANNGTIPIWDTKKKKKREGTASYGEHLYLSNSVLRTDWIKKKNAARPAITRSTLNRW